MVVFQDTSTKIKNNMYFLHAYNSRLRQGDGKAAANWCAHPPTLLKPALKSVGGKMYPNFENLLQQSLYR